MRGGRGPCRIRELPLKWYLSCRRRQFFGLGNPAWDLVYFLVLGSVDPAEDAQLLAEYHATLVEGDAPGEGIRAEYSLVRPVL